jgi:AcrR family transcriptional regulator
MKKIDRRVLRTRQSLGDALVDLTLENGYDSITIKDLTESAGIGYATFFRHFKSKDELLMYVLEVILDDISSMTESDMNAYEKALVTFQYIADNARIYRVFVSLPRQSELTNAVHRVISASIMQSYRPRNESRIPMDVAVNHIVTSIIELIRWWVMNDLSLSVEQMALIQSELIIKATEIVALEPVWDEMAMMD